VRRNEFKDNKEENEPIQIKYNNGCATFSINRMHWLGDISHIINTYILNVTIQNEAKNKQTTHNESRSYGVGTARCQQVFAVRIPTQRVDALVAVAVLACGNRLGGIATVPPEA
jgi:hypothetical protein